jgi:hypothetical protein
MTSQREQIYAALFAQLQGPLLAPAGPFKTVSRRWQDPSQISPPDRPALYQVQKDELAKTSVIGVPVLWKIGLDLVIYTAGEAEPNVVQSTELNHLLDAVEAALQSATPGLTQSLGRQVSYCRIEGKLEIVENVQGTMAMAVVPILIEITA